MDENHPMLNRTWVAGDKIDNTLAEHLDADMLQTEQSFIQTYHSQHYQLPGSTGFHRFTRRGWGGVEGGVKSWMSWSLRILINPMGKWMM